MEAAQAIEERAALGAKAVRDATSLEPEVAIVLGSGLGPLADEIENATAIPFSRIPGFPVSTAPGHAGRLVLGSLEGRRVMAFQGRVHLYEGYSAAEAGLPVRLAHALGARTIIVTNACGGLNPHWRAGDIMLQLDFINLTGQNPLTGPNNDGLGPRFPVMFDCYDAGLNDLARRAARSMDLSLREGVYLSIAGPAFATRAELRMCRALGADAIGMSTVSEVIQARHLSMRVLGLSTVTDMALPDADHADGNEILEQARVTGPRFRSLVRSILKGMPS